MTIRVGTTAGPGGGIKVATTAFAAFEPQVTGTGTWSQSLQAALSGTGTSELLQVTGTGTLAVSLTASLTGTGNVELIFVTGTGAWAAGSLQAAFSGQGEVPQLAFNTGSDVELWQAGSLQAAFSGVGTAAGSAASVIGTGTFVQSMTVAFDGIGTVENPQQVGTVSGTWSQALQAGLTGSGQVSLVNVISLSGTWSAALQAAFSGTGESVFTAHADGTEALWSVALQAALTGSGTSVDLMPPDLLAARLTAARDELILVFDETVVAGSGGNGGFALTASDGEVTLTFSSLSTNVMRFELSRRIGLDETMTLDYTQPGDGLQDLSANALASFDDFPVFHATGVGAASQAMRAIVEPRRMLAS